ncbi:hypothetical protein HOY82DRAFT_551988, partial [Tuber indicum]
MLPACWIRSFLFLSLPSYPFAHLLLLNVSSLAPLAHASHTTHHTRTHNNKRSLHLTSLHLTSLFSLGHSLSLSLSLTAARFCPSHAVAGAV